MMIKTKRWKFKRWLRNNGFGLLVILIAIYFMAANYDEIPPLELSEFIEEFATIFEPLETDTNDGPGYFQVQEPERKQECLRTFSENNDVRESYGKSRLKWDDRLYELAVFRAKDMHERNYFDHVTPEGTCDKDFKSEFGITEDETIAENLGFIGYELTSKETYGECSGHLDSWMTSRGHRYNLLYDDHEKGAIGCYYSICVFYGLHYSSYGLGAGECTTGDEGKEFWRNIEEQPGEV